MQDNDTPHSGSRWEPPTPEQGGAGHPPQAAPPQPSPDAAGGATPPPPGRPDPSLAAWPTPPPPAPQHRGVRSAVVAGFAVAALVAGAAGGFAVGRATAGSGQADRTGSGDFRHLPGGYGTPPDFDGRGGRGTFRDGDQQQGSNT
ncbi:hypothetical protein HFP15_27935 [Amycolatopsis sp. K13G38]|uniref:Serine protease n=1 Tax=Amycolatopsis acididurans TaxID=2724524 RepID=A0ABX1JE93_9PSEU|nr:hypothetical protein [Amycolatopsis acididurans]NKQ56710.1 hypothetical protein [Amycolatopsis acididurans]